MEKRKNITLYFVLLLCAGLSFLFFFLCNYWLVNEVLFEGMVPQTKITDPALKKIFRRLNMNSDLYLLVKRAHPSHGALWQQASLPVRVLAEYITYKAHHHIYQ